jgi:hypothetical protein
MAARIMAQAAPGKILVSSSLRDLVVGSGIGFTDRSSHELKGVPGRWQLLAADPNGAQPGSAEAVLAEAMPVLHLRWCQLTLCGSSWEVPDRSPLPGRLAGRECSIVRNRPVSPMEMPQDPAVMGAMRQ